MKISHLDKLSTYEAMSAPTINQNEHCLIFDSSSEFDAICFVPCRNSIQGQLAKFLMQCIFCCQVIENLISELSVQIIDG